MTDKQNTEVAAKPAVDAPPVAQFDNPRVQTVYEILCGHDDPPMGEHWEGWVSRRIVDALTTGATFTKAPPAGSNLLPALTVEDAAHPASEPKAEAGAVVRHVGESNFEGWYQQYAARLTGNLKQTARDAYAAGMGDASAGEPIAWLCVNGCTVGPDAWLEVCESTAEGAFPVYERRHPASEQKAAAIHYPECWDTAAYPTVESALSEVYAAFKCTNHIGASEPKALTDSDVYTLIGHADYLRGIGQEDMPKWCMELAERIARTIGDKALADRAAALLADRGSETKPVAKIVGADEYGPMLEWSTHWVELIGKSLYTDPYTEQS
jgi:hypothetical protein